MNIDLLDKFSQHLRSVLARAVDTAFEAHYKQITPILLLWSLSVEENCVAAKVLHKHKLTPEVLKVASPLAMDNPGVDWPEFTPQSRQVLEKAAVIALERKHSFVGTEHVLDGLLELNDPQVNTLLKQQHVAVKQMKQQLQNLLHSTSRFSEVTAPLHVNQQDQLVDSPTPALDHFGVDMSQASVAKTYTHVVAREEEIQRVIHILARRTKNNPLLLGEPGVGKTAIVEGLAKQIASGSVPPFLKGKRLVALDMALLVAGSMYRGEFEGRLKQVIDEIKQHPEIILFIDEIHTVIGAGSVGGNSLDAANILKPALARGDLHCIGATTFAEYQKQFESDPALARRFQAVMVEEPSETQAIAMLRGMRKTYELFHRVKITDAAIQQAVLLSIRYMTDRALPDKALDVLDEACSQKRLAQAIHPLRQKFDSLEQAAMNAKQDKMKAVREEHFKEAIHYKQMEGKIKVDLARVKKELAGKELAAVVDEASVLAVVARMTGVPVEAMQTSDRSQLVGLEQGLNATVVGQREVIHQVAACIKRGRVGLQAPDRPLGSFLFLGPSGVGKTELARQVARQVFGDDSALVKIDMSEFNESFTVTKLIGAPAGYVGFKEGARLTDQVRKKPYCVVLFDEVEKAHPDVFNVLLQILDEGRLTDAAGRKINFRNTVIMLTSNIGLEQFNRTQLLGFGSQTERARGQREFSQVVAGVKGELKEVFRPEFLNRLDQILVFRPLDQKALEKIVGLRFAELAQRVKTQGISLLLSAEAKHWVAEKAAEPEQGARLITQLIQQYIEQPLADMMLAQTDRPSVVTVGVLGKKLVLEV